MKFFVCRSIPESICPFKNWVFAVLLVLTFVLDVRSQEQPHATAEPATPQQSISDSGAVEIPESAKSATEEKRRRASVALLAVGGIAIVGVGIIAGTMIWARRLRRLARDHGPRQRTMGNDFWFLKPRKLAAPGSRADNGADDDRRDDKS